MFRVYLNIETISAQKSIPLLIKPLIISTLPFIAAYFQIHSRIFLLLRETLWTVLLSNPSIWLSDVCYAMYLHPNCWMESNQIDLQVEQEHLYLALLPMGFEEGLKATESIGICSGVPSSTIF